MSNYKPQSEWLRLICKSLTTPAVDLEDIITAAAANLGYPAVKEEQRQAITAFVSGKDVFVALPTGYGKSLCYVLLQCVFDVFLAVRQPTTSIVICISPLVSLMQDQKDRFSPRGLVVMVVIT